MGSGVFNGDLCLPLLGASQFFKSGLEGDGTFVSIVNTPISASDADDMTGLIIPERINRAPL